MAKRTAKATTRILNRINESLSGADVFAYTGAVFSVLGMIGAKSKGAKSGAIASFYNSASIIRHHTANGNFGRKDGRVILTAKGQKYFRDRMLEDSAQHTDKREIAALVKAIKSGKTKDLPEAFQGRGMTMSPITIAK